MLPSNPLLACAGCATVLTPGIIYRPPEMLLPVECRRSAAIVLPSSDIWAFGVIAYELITGSPAFPSGSSRSDIADQISGRRPLPWEAEGAGERVGRCDALGDMGSVMFACVHRCADKRPTAADVVSRISEVLACAATSTGTV
jgi:serine/threonine protein kinase